MIYMTVRFGTYDKRTKTLVEFDSADIEPGESVNDVLDGFVGVNGCEAAELVLCAPSGETSLAHFYQVTTRRRGKNARTTWRVR